MLTRSLACALLLAASSAHGATFYVAQNALGAATGADSANAISLATANSTAAAGRTYQLTAGTYTTKINPAAGGNGFHPDSAVIYMGRACAADAATEMKSWASCDSAAGDVVVPGATVTKDYVMLRGIKFDGDEIYVENTAAGALGRDSVSWSTVIRTGVGGITGYATQDLVIYRNRIRVRQTVDSTGQGDGLLFFHNDSKVGRDSRGLKFVKNRIYAGTIGSAPRLAGCGTTCEEVIWHVKKQFDVWVDSNLVEVEFKKHASPSKAYSPGNSMLLYLAETDNWNSKDNRVNLLMLTKHRRSTGLVDTWKPIIVRDSVGMTNGAHSVHGFRMVRDTIVTHETAAYKSPKTTDSIAAWVHMGGGNWPISPTLDSCVFKVATSGVYQAQAWWRGRIRGSVFANPAGAALKTNARMDGMRIENSTFLGKPGLYLGAGPAHFVGDRTWFQSNVYANLSGSDVEGETRGAVFYTDANWLDHPMPAMTANLFWGHADSVQRSAVHYWSAPGPDANRRAKVQSGLTRCPGEDCWCAPGIRPWECDSWYGDPGFTTTNPDSFWGDVRCGGMAANLRRGAHTPRVSYPAAFTVSDTAQTQTSITLHWVQPGEDSLRSALPDTSSYVIYISTSDPEANGYFDSDVMYDGVYGGNFLETIKRVEGLQDDILDYSIWRRANVSGITRDNNGLPGTKARAKVEYYWNLSGYTGTTALASATKYFFVMQARNGCGYYGNVTSFSCAWTDDATPGGVLACP